MSSFYDIFAFKALSPSSEAEGLPASEQGFPGANIRNIIESPEGRLMTRTAIRMAPSVPPVIAFEEVFEALIGDAAFSNDMKQYAGYLIRRVVDDMGGSFVDKGVKIKRRSRFTRGSTYSL